MPPSGDLRLFLRLRVRVGRTSQLRNRRVRDLSYPPRPTHPDGRPLLARPGAPAGRRLLGPRVRAGDPRERGVSRRRRRRGAVSRRPPSLAGRRAAFLAGGEEGAVALASASRSSPAHPPVRRAQPAPALLPHPPLAQQRAHRPPTAEPPATSPTVPQPQREAAGNGRGSVVDPEALPPPPARLSRV